MSDITLAMSAMFIFIQRLWLQLLFGSVGHLAAEQPDTGFPSGINRDHYRAEG